MVENERDAQFVQEILNRLPSSAVPAGLEARILADFDRAMAPSRLQQVLGRLGDWLWPGVPVWQPASVLAVSLVFGLMAGALLPVSGAALAATDQAVAALDNATVASLDNTSDVDLDKDL